MLIICVILCICDDFPLSHQTQFLSIFLVKWQHISFYSKIESGNISDRDRQLRVATRVVSITFLLILKISIKNEDNSSNPSC